MSASWEISELDGWLEVRTDEGRLIAEVFDQDDARLINAAPRLLAACKLARLQHGLSSIDYRSNVLDQIDAAIAEAEPKKALAS